MRFFLLVCSISRNGLIVICGMPGKKIDRPLPACYRHPEFIWWSKAEYLFQMQLIDLLNLVSIIIIPVAVIPGCYREQGLIPA